MSSIGVSLGRRRRGFCQLLWACFWGALEPKQGPSNHICIDHLLPKARAGVENGVSHGRGAS